MKITLKIPEETKQLWRSLWHNRWLRYSVYALGITIPLGIYAAALITVPNTFVGGQLVRAGEVNTNFKTLYDTLGITDAKGLTVTANIEAQGFTLNGVPVGSSSDSFWSVAGTGNIAYNSGNVGIGITPTTKFHVNGTTTLDGDAIIKGTAATGAALDVQNSGATSLLYVGNDGRVGIGTSSPAGSLHIVGDTTTIQMKVEQLNTGSFNASLSLHQSGNAVGRDWRLTSINTGGFKIRDKTASADRFSIDTSGNVGIGTTSPAAKLQVVGNESVTAGVDRSSVRISDTSTGGQSWSLISFGSASTEGVGKFGINLNGTGSKFIIDTSGRVGIGCTKPDNILEVGGGNSTGCNTGAGSFLVAGTGWANNSSRKIKENIMPFVVTNIIDKIAQTPVTKYDFRNCKDKKTAKTELG